jgi:hypothetical protein
MPRHKRQAFAGVKTKIVLSKDHRQRVKAPASNSAVSDQVEFVQQDHSRDVVAAEPIAEIETKYAMSKDQSGNIKISAPYSVADGHATSASNGHGMPVSATEPIADVDDQSCSVRMDHGIAVSASASKSIASDHGAFVQADQCEYVTDAIALIREHCRRVMFVRKQRIRIHNALGAFIRLQLGWRHGLPEEEAKKIKNKAAKLITAGGGEWASLVVATNEAALPFHEIEKSHIEEMKRLAKSFPVWTNFGAGVNGFGAASLAVIVGVAGALSNYSDKGKLWKRLGLAVINGSRQGSPGPGADDVDWIEHGYDRQRRSLIWQIGATMIKAQVRKVKDDDDEDTGERYATGCYGELYLKRKQYEIGRVGLTKKGGPNGKHAHLRAQRYMEKALIRDLWRAWREVMPSAAALPIPSEQT